MTRPANKRNNKEGTETERRSLQLPLLKENKTKKHHKERKETKANRKAVSWQTIKVEKSKEQTRVKEP